MEDLAKKLPQGFSYSWTGLSLEELQSGGTSLLLFGLGTLVVYLTLSAQYESFVLPFIVLLAVADGIAGRLGAQWIRGLQNDVFCQVGPGDAGRTFQQERDSDRGICRAVAPARSPAGGSRGARATIRLRPILMTSLAFILGVVPLVLATGAGETAVTPWAQPYSAA